MRKFIYTCIFTSILILFSTYQIKAHPQPLVITELIFNYKNTEIYLNYRLRIDPAVIDAVYPEIDTNHDNITTNEELKLYYENSVAPYLSVKLNNHNINFEYISSEPINKRDFRSLNDYISINLKAQNLSMQEINTVHAVYSKRHLPNDFYGDSILYEDNISERNKLQKIETPQENLEFGTYIAMFKFTDNINEKEQNSLSHINLIDNIRNSSTQLINNIRYYDFSNPLALFPALFFAFIAGALHAATPGHGKSIMATVLVSKKGANVYDIMIIGLSVTLAHTLVIFILGFMLLLLNRTSEAQVVISMIERISAFLFIGLGLILFYNGYKAYKNYKYLYLYGKKAQSSRNILKNNKLIDITNKWSLFYAGISGGMIPCIDALSLLFAFTSLGRIDLGLITVFTFSLGLASSIILLGSLILKGKTKIRVDEKFGKQAEFLSPIISGFIILIFGMFYVLSK